EGSFSGTKAGTGAFSSTVVNVPKSKMSTGLWYTYNWGVSAGSSDRFAMAFDNCFSLGAPYTDHFPQTALFRPEELWNIDQKLDDGLPGQGKVVAFLWDGCTDAADETDVTSDYLLSDFTPQCVAIMRQQY